MAEDTDDTVIDEDTGISTQQSVSGFVVGDFRMQQTKTGEPALTMRVGQEHFKADGRGGFEQLENTYFPLVQFGRAAERTFAQFKPGDRFVAEGEVRPFQFQNREGEQVKGHEFVARKIGHDTAWTRYEVDRSPRQPAAARDAPQVEQGGPGAARSVADEEPSPAAKARTPRPRKPPIPEADPTASEPALAAAGADIPF